MYFLTSQFFLICHLVQFKHFFFTAGSTVVLFLLTARDVLVLVLRAKKAVKLQTSSITSPDPPPLVADNLLTDPV